MELKPRETGAQTPRPRPDGAGQPPRPPAAAHPQAAHPHNAAHPQTARPAARGNVERLELVRRRKRMRHIRMAAVCVLLLAAVLAGLMGLYGAPLAMLGDWVDSVSIALTPGPGYPVPFTLSGYRNALPLAGGFAAVGEQDLVMYSAGGNELRRIQHGYGRPAITAGNTRVCLYDRAGKQLRVESRSRTLFENKFEEAIQLCAMSPNGTLAVFVRSKLYVYDPLFQNIYTFRTQDLPTALTFASDNRHFAAGCPGAEGGALGGVVYLMDLNRDAYITIRTADGMPLKLQYLTGGTLLVLYDSFAAVYDTSDGTELHRYDYGGRTLQSADVSAGKNAVLLFGDGAHGALTQLVVLDDTLSEVGAAFVNRRANSVAAVRTGAFVLTNDGTLAYTLDGTFCAEELLPDRPLDLLQSGGRLLLLTQGEAREAQPPEKKAETTAGAGA